MLGLGLDSGGRWEHGHELSSRRPWQFCTRGGEEGNEWRLEEMERWCVGVVRRAPLQPMQLGTTCTQGGALRGRQGANSMLPRGCHMVVSISPSCRYSGDKKGTRNVAHFGKFGPLSTIYNFSIGVRVIRLLDFELQTSKLWFVSTAQNSGN
jgi:hypothetical protein